MKSLIIAIATLMTVNAHAETTTQVLYTPKAGQMALTPELLIGPSGSFTTEGTPSTKVDFSGSLLDLDFMFGVDNEMSVGAHILTGNVQIDTSTGGSKGKTKVSGMSDLVLKMRMTSGMWIFGGDLGLPLENNKSNLDSDTGNFASGGLSLIPMGGIIMQSGSINYGGTLSYSYLLDRKEETTASSTTTTDTVSGGSHLNIGPFVEWNFGSGFLFGQMTLSSYSDTTTKSNGTSTTAKTTSHNNLKVGATYDFAPTITGLADLSMDMYEKNTDAGNPAYNLTTIGLGARFVF